MSSLDQALKKIYAGGDPAWPSGDEDAAYRAATREGDLDSSAAAATPQGGEHTAEPDKAQRSDSPSVEDLYEVPRSTMPSIYHDPATPMPPAPHADFSPSRKPLQPHPHDADQDLAQRGSAEALLGSDSPPHHGPAQSRLKHKTLRIDTVEGSPLKPAFQVDRFIWPDPCDRLLEVAEATLGRLAEALVTESRAGHKSWYLTSTRRGEGRTTLAICVARYLAERGVTVALLDADFQNPQLARRLGVLPQVGWESVLAGVAPLAEAMIHATGAGVTLLPLLSARIDLADVSQNTRWSDTLRQLRRNYTLVVIDGGPLGEGELDHGLIERHGLVDLDGALLLRDVRNTPLTELAATERRLSEAGLPYGAVAETFTAEA